MAQFRYDTAANPFALSIAESLARRGDIAAQRALAIGEAQARAAQMRGAAWGNALQTVGQTVAALPQQMQAARDAEQDREMRGLQMDAAREQLAGVRQQREDRAVLQSAQSSRLTPDQVKEQLQALGRGDLVPLYEQANTEIEASRLNLRNLRQQVESADRDYVGTLALQIKRANFDPLAVEWALGEAEADGHDVSQIRQALERDPAQLQGMVDRLIGLSPSAQKALADEEGRRLQQDANTRANMQAMETAANTTRDNQRLDAQVAETARHNRAMEAAANTRTDNEPLVQVAGPNGTTIWVRRSDAIRQPAAQAARGVTGAERKVLGFFQRMLEAERNARAVEDAVGGRDFAAEWAPGAWLENFLKTPEGQRYTQAQRTFTEARLRKESGAAIPQGEYDTDRDTNFRRPNDTTANITQKRAARLRLLRSAANEAGRALQEYYGADQDIESLLSEFEGPNTTGVMVNMRAPDGRSLQVPAEQVDEAKRRGATVVGQ